MKQTLIILGVICPLFIIVYIVWRVIYYMKAVDQTEFNDTFEIDGRIYRFNKQLTKDEYINLRDKFVGDRTYRQCTEYHALQDYDVDVDTLVATKSMYYSRYHSVY